MKFPEIKITNTATSKKETLVPLTPGKIKMYSCGPTVYDFIHIGNLRAALTSDMIFRYLKKVGYDVTYVRNYTDIDDRIIKKAIDENSTLEKVSQRYISEVEKDYLVAGVAEPTHKTTVTDHIQEIIVMIEAILKNKKGYVVEGEVFFSIESFPTYGKLSRKNLEDLIAGARVEIDKRKKSPADFSLWKPAKPGEPAWDSPWGKGRPGWHIECSAMAGKWLGDQMDIHHGGEDLVFPHHENEIAQSEAATGTSPYVKYWMHNAFLNINHEKMSKSLGNFTLARQFLTQYGVDVARMMLLSSHYRSIIDYNDQAVDQALTGLERIYEAKQKALELTKLKSTLPDMRAEGAWGSFVAECESTKKLISEQFSNDFNTPSVLAAVFTLIRDFNRVLGEPRAATTPTAVLGAQALLQVLEEDLGEVLVIGKSDPARVLQKIQELRAEKLGASRGQKIDETKINALIADRIQARKEKNFGRADEIRKELDEMGITIKDSGEKNGMDTQVGRNFGGNGMEHIWFKSYERGIPHEIDLKEYSSISDLLEQSFHKFADRPAFHNMGKTYTFAEMKAMSQQFAAYLQNDLKLKKGDRVAIMMPNIIQYPVVLFAALQSGLVVVNVNPLYTPRELEHQLKDSGAETIVIVANFATTLQKVIANTKVKNVIVTQLGDMLGFPKSLIVNTVVKYVKKMVPAYSLPQAVNFSTALAQGSKSSFTKVTTTHSDIAFLQYTGGTTGVSKGAILSHGNIVSNMLQARAWIKNLIKEGEEIIITPLPLYHIFSLTANCFIFSSIGALNILITNPRDFPGFVKELKKWKFTAFTGVNTLFNALVNREDFRQVDFSKLKIALGGGMAVQKAVAEKWKEITGTPLIEAYGLTETSPAACINPMNLKDYNGLIGLPLSSTDVTIKDDDEKNVNIGDVGEICIKGPQVMRGYWQREHENDKVFSKDGYLKTGDMGYMTPEGFIKIVDRKKDMILVSGFNVYPNEIEDVVCTHPKVLECAAIAIKDEKSGEVPKIFVVKKDSSLTEEEIIKFCKENMTNYKVPRYVEFRTDLPKTNVGKILRKDLKEQEAKKRS